MNELETDKSYVKRLKELEEKNYQIRQEIYLIDGKIQELNNEKIALRKKYQRNFEEMWDISEKNKLDK